MPSVSTSLKAVEPAPCGHTASLFGCKGGTGGAAHETPARIAAHSAVWSTPRRVLPAVMVLIASGSECLQRRHVDPAVARLPDQYAFGGNFLPDVAAGIENIDTQQFEGRDAERVRSSGFELRHGGRLGVRHDRFASLGQQPLVGVLLLQATDHLHDVRRVPVWRSPSEAGDGVLRERAEHLVPTLILPAKVGDVLGPAVASRIVGFDTLDIVFL